MIKMDLIENIEAIKYKNGKAHKTKEKIVKDENIQLKINNSQNKQFSVCYDSLEEFAIGYILGEKIIDSIDEIENIEIDNNLIKINIKKNIDDEDHIIVSDGGGGWRSKIKIIEEVNSNITVNSSSLIHNMEKLKESARIWQNTGGTHVAAIIHENEFIVKEDVSRHVAVDKVIGAGALKNFDFSKSYIIYSGRMPADMLIKIARVGIPLIVSNAAPSSSGYEIAKKGNITMVGFLRGNRFNVYTNSQRINFEK